VSSKKQYSATEKLLILREIETSQTTLVEIARKYDLHRCTLSNWRHRYNLYGYKGLELRTHHKTYSADLKIQAVQEYLSGNGSQRQIIDKHKISSRTQLMRWIQKYNNHSSFKSNEGGGTPAMIKGRHTTWQERIDIVLYCLSRNFLPTSISMGEEV